MVELLEREVGYESKKPEFLESLRNPIIREMLGRDYSREAMSHNDHWNQYSDCFLVS
ncbi:Uncharacterised protein [uncultured archaeon]|nr:Uncharacterised protein [uncultured archaeon]